MAQKARAARKDEKAARPKPTEVVPVASWPAWQIERKPAEWLKPHPRNARVHPVGQLTELDLSFAAHGAVTPFVANLNGEILRGHGGMASVEHLHGKGIEVPVVVVDWPEALQLEYMLRDNAIAERSAWGANLGVQVADLAKIRGVDASALHIGLKAAHLKKLAPEIPAGGAHDADQGAPDAPAEPVSRLGDVWQLGEHRLMCGDATSADHVATLLAGERPPLMVTDQPYGVDYDPAWRGRAVTELGARMDGSASGGGAAEADENMGRAVGEIANDMRLDWREAFALFPGDVAYVWCASLGVPEAVAALESCGLMRRYQLIWNKNKHAISRGHYHWKHEPCLYHVREGANGRWQGSRSENTVWDIASHGGGDAGKKDMATGHGTQKPVECMARPMRNNSAPGDLVYDPFCGSGTTIIAAHGLARRGRCMELLPQYVDVAILRWEGFTGQRARFAAGGEEWGAVAAARGVKLAT